MTTTTPRARAGKPYTPPMPMRRVQPIDFVLPDDDAQAVRSGFDAAMKAPISKPIAPQGCTGDCRQGRDCTCQAETISEFSADVTAATVSFWVWSGLMWTACWLGIGYFFGRFVS